MTKTHAWWCAACRAGESTWRMYQFMAVLALHWAAQCMSFETLSYWVASALTLLVWLWSESVWMLVNARQYVPGTAVTESLASWLCYMYTQLLYKGWINPVISWWKVSNSHVAPTRIDTWLWLLLTKCHTVHAWSSILFAANRPAVGTSCT